jgi:homogentisate 1,2-dioxygenase
MMNKVTFSSRSKNSIIFITTSTPRIPFDVVGWDGFNYPYGFSIHNFEPITGRLHQPPPVHQTFEGHNFVVCSFCPRLYDYHPRSYPAPNNHSNIDSDEVIYYSRREIFMSRNDVSQGHLTLHRAGISARGHTLVPWSVAFGKLKQGTRR